MKIEKVTEPIQLGEGPHWDSTQNVLYFICFDHTIHKYDPSTEKHTKTKLDDHASFIIPIEGTSDHFVVSQGKKLIVIRWDGGEGSPVTTLKELCEVDQDVDTTFNDAKADPRGRLFAGTLNKKINMEALEATEGKGSIYRIEGSAPPEKLWGGIRIANGLAWDLNEKAFYYVDSADKAVRRYDYDVTNGNISNMKYIFNFEENNVKGVPDGMTIDTDGNLWIAVFEGSSVIKVDPRTGKLLETIPMPAAQVTSVTFGGPDLDTVYVTTASLDYKEAQEPPSGATFRITGLGVKGYPNLPFKL